METNYALITSLLSSSVITAVVSAFFGAIASLFTSKRYWKQKTQDLEAEYLSRFNTKKWEIYTEFINLAPKLIDVNPDMDSAPEGAATLDSLAAQIVLAGSDEVVTAFRSWREANETYEHGNQITKERFSRLIAQMRKDLGNRHTQLEINDMLGALKPLAYK